MIPQSVKKAVAEELVTHIPVDAISNNPHQPRKRFDEDKLKALSESIRNDGVLQPVVVRKNGDRYELIMGERRLQAARLAGVQQMPVVVKAVEEVDALRLALVENLQREDLNPMEVAGAYRSLIAAFGLSQNELSRLVAKNRSSVANTLRLLSLPEEIRSMVVEGTLSEGHARALLSLSTKAEQLAMARRIQQDNLNVRQVETEAGQRRQSKGSAKATKEKSPHISFLENAIARHLSTRVTLDEKRGGKGKLVIEFYSHEDFERLAEMMHIPLPR